MKRSAPKSRVFVQIDPSAHGKQIFPKRAVSQKMMPKLRSRLVLTCPVAALDQRLAKIFVTAVLRLNGSSAVSVSVSEGEIV